MLKVYKYELVDNEGRIQQQSFEVSHNYFKIIHSHQVSHFLLCESHHDPDHAELQLAMDKLIRVSKYVGRAIGQKGRRRLQNAADGADNTRVNHVRSYDQLRHGDEMIEYSMMQSITDLFFINAIDRIWLKGGTGDLQALDHEHRHVNGNSITVNDIKQATIRLNNLGLSQYVPRPVHGNDGGTNLFLARNVNTSNISAKVSVLLHGMQDRLLADYPELRKYISECGVRSYFRRTDVAVYMNIAEAKKQINESLATIRSLCNNELWQVIQN